ncbi:MAG: SMC-Scp complex subunit ScpB [Patescibacteria group bacterium]
MDNNTINQQNSIASLEAILFAYGEPITINKIAKLLNVEIDETKISLENLQKELESENRGLRLIFSDNKVQMATKPEFSHLLEEFIKEEFKESLTPATLETISLIAYFGPISRAKIDYFRGVNSSFTLRSLLMRGLIERLEDKKEHGGYLYQLTFDSLKYLGISKIEDLPEFEKYKNLSVINNN